MGTVIVQYKVKPDRANENVEYIKGVFAELATSSPAGLRYASFQGEDGLTFVHVASIETATARIHSLRLPRLLRSRKKSRIVATSHQNR